MQSDLSLFSSVAVIELTKMVSEQTGAVQVLPWCKTQQLVQEGANLYLQYSTLRGAQSTSAWSPPFPRDTALPMLPTRL